MKKTYMIPSMKVVMVKSAHILAGSVSGTSGADGLGKGADWSSGSANSREARFSADDDWED